MIFVATDSIDENIARIVQRAQGGVHRASEREVRAPPGWLQKALSTPEL